jgi:RNA polymerase sigma-70 factor (ECF subfamily)
VPDSLLQKISSGDREAANACVEKYGNLVWSLARRFTFNAADAEDAVQEIFIEVWSKAAQFDPAKGSETTFIAMIARRRLIDKMRKSQREPRSEELSEAMELPGKLISDDLEVRDEAAQAQRLIGKLKPAQQRVIHLAIYQGLTHQTIAEKLGIPLGTVKTHIRRGLLSLREGLQASRLEAERGVTR